MLVVLFLIGVLVVDNLIVFFHGVDHFAVDGRKTQTINLLIFAKVKVLEITLQHHSQIFFLMIFWEALPGESDYQILKLE